MNNLPRDPFMLFSYVNMKLRDEYIKREVARRMEAEKGKTEEQRRKESDEAVQEVIDREKHASTLLDMADQLKTDEGGKDNDWQNDWHFHYTAADPYDALRMILETAETKKMPPIGIVPTFNDSLIEDQVMAIFGLISGGKSK